jgi:hypothetical protein
MNDTKKTLHLGTKLPRSFYSIFFCNGRAVSNPFAITSEFSEVTCKSCLKKMAANPLPAVQA